MRIAFKSKLALLALLFFCSVALAQDKGDVNDYFDDKGGFGRQLWYGGGVNLGFSGNNGFSQFIFGLSPMVGYKFTDDLSVGPRVSLLYSYFKARTFNGTVDSAQPLSWAVGVFARYKLLPSIFAHVEYELEDEAFVIVTDKLEVLRQNRSNAYVGAGYNSGDGLWGYEISVLFNLLEDNSSTNVPFIIRAGITYNF